MITKWIEFRVAAEHADTFAAEFQRMEQLSQPEAGCSVYRVFRGAGEEGRNLFTVLEAWETSGHLEAHRESAHMAAFKERCAAMIVDKRALDLATIDS